jgi:hypothetical protein
MPARLRWQVSTARKRIAGMMSRHGLFASAFLVLLLVAGCTREAPTSRSMETTPSGSSAGQAQPARAR